MTITFTTNIKDLLLALNTIKKFLPGTKNRKLEFIVKLKVTKVKLIVFGIGNEQIIKTSGDNKRTGFIYIPIELLVMILESAKAKELTLTFNQGEVAYLNAKSCNKKILLSKTDLNDSKNETLVPKEIKDKPISNNPIIKKPKQRSFFSEKDILKPNSNDTNYVNNILRREIEKIYHLAINKLPENKKSLIINQKETSTQKFNLIIKTTETKQLKISKNNHWELYFTINAPHLELIYSENFDYQFMLKEEYDKLKNKIDIVRRFLEELYLITEIQITEI